MGHGSIAELLRARELGSVPDRSTVPERLEVDAALYRWAEKDVFQHCDATYCDVTPSPRSTIAIAFSPDGAYLASTQCASHPERP